MASIAKRPNDIMVPAGSEITLFGKPCSQTRYSLAVSIVLAVVSVVLLMANWY